MELVRYTRERGMTVNHFQTVRFEVFMAMTIHIMYGILVGTNGSEERTNFTFCFKIEALKSSKMLVSTFRIILCHDVECHKMNFQV
jgi:hypothetical protein